MGNTESTNEEESRYDSSIQVSQSDGKLPSILISSSPHSSNMSLTSAKRRKYLSSESLNDYGWFEDFESPSSGNLAARTQHSHEVSLMNNNNVSMHEVLAVPAPVTSPPMYVLESSLQTQQLWYTTCGQRPKQPQHEREYFEKLWSQNFRNSEINYGDDNGHDCTHDTPPARKRASSRADINTEVVYRGKAPFSNSVTKSFPASRVASMTLQIPYYRIVRDNDDALGRLHAEFLVVVSLTGAGRGGGGGGGDRYGGCGGGIGGVAGRNRGSTAGDGGSGVITFGVWRRHSEFQSLASVVWELDVRTGMFKNANLSWQCVLERKRWFKSLDTEYLALKCFLIERFVHDLLFEAPNMSLICDFLGLEE